MGTSMTRKLKRLNADYAEVTGKAFDHFFCPIVFRDEAAPLCRAHIINQAFADCSSIWTVQRKDVDNFYGSYFESDFIAIEYHERGWKPFDILASQELQMRYRPKLMLDSGEVEYYEYQGEPVPAQHTPVRIGGDERNPERIIVIKVPSDRLVQAKVEIAVNKDARIASLVSLLKAAHLTLFELLGYRYVFSPAGQFMGKQLLGDFYLRVIGSDRRPTKETVLQKALPYFAQYAHMVRPVESLHIDARGTIDDGVCLRCGEHEGETWGLIVFINILGKFHSVLVPECQSPSSVLSFLSFLVNKRESLHVARCQYRADTRMWLVDRSPYEIHWPKTGVLYPESSVPTG